MKHCIEMILAVLLSVVWTPFAIVAQQSDASATSSSAFEDGTIQTETVENASDSPKVLPDLEPSSGAETVSALKKKLAEQDARIRAINERNAEKNAELRALKKAVMSENDDFQEIEVNAESNQSFLSFWGYFDLMFFKRFYDEHGTYNYFLLSNSSFVLTNINLYLKSVLTNTFSALLETSLTFLPIMAEEELEYVDVPGSEYRRRDMEVINPYTSEMSNVGGINIERIHLQWSPKDWFNVLAGRYLTPFGIWNIDHGSPVVLTIQVPYMQLRNMVVKAQTGLQIHGRFFPNDDIHVEYALTLSNGRGPTEAVFDLDENKAVGLRLHLTFDNSTVQFSVGGYGYVGTEKDDKKVVSVKTRDDGTLDMDAKDPIRVDRIDVGAGREIVLTADIKLRLFGITLQGEYVWKRVDFDEPFLFTTDYTLLQGGSVADEWYYASYLGYSVYGLLAYTLPLEKWIAPVTITPYFFIEKNISYDTASFANFDTIWFGVNIKPNVFLTLKGEYTHTIPELDVYGVMHSFALQMAVSF